MKELYLNIVFYFIKNIFILRHQFFEVYHRSIFVKNLKSISKKFIPDIIFNHFKKLKIKQLEEFPEAISIETVNICNAKCWFCPQPEHTRTKGYMDMDLYKMIIDEISENRKRVKSIALFMDGEPTLHKKLIEFLKYAKSKNIKNIYLSSNMEFFSEKIINQIFEQNLHQTLKYVICSLDGVSETTHQSNRIGVDTKKAYENTHLLIKKKNQKRSIYPWVFPRMLINETNKHEEKEFYNYWRGKADKVLRTAMHNWGGQIKDKRLNLADHGFSKICYFPFSQCFIQINGGIRLCCLDVNGEYIFGDLENNSITEIWRSKKFTDLRKNFLDQDYNKLPKLCHNCSYPSKGTWTLPYFW